MNEWYRVFFRKFQAFSMFTHPGNVELTSALQAVLPVSSIIYYVAGILLVTHGGIFLLFPFSCTACIQSISSLQTVHTISICFRAHRCQMINFIAYSVFNLKL